MRNPKKKKNQIKIWCEEVHETCVNILDECLYFKYTFVSYALSILHHINLYKSK